MHYLILPAPTLADSIARYGAFLAGPAWLPLDDATDPFGRGASPLPYDREDRRRVMQDGRPFVVGLSDDAGGGNALGLAASNLFAPDPTQLRRLDEYVHHTLLSKKAHPALANRTFSLQDPASWRIRMSTRHGARGARRGLLQRPGVATRGAARRGATLTAALLRPPPP